MGIGEIIAIITLLLTYAAALITSYINIKLKIKEIEMKIDTLQIDLTDYKKNNNEIYRDMVNDNKIEHQEILKKLDIMMEKIYEIKIENEKKSNIKN